MEHFKRIGLGGCIVGGFLLIGLLATAFPVLFAVLMFGVLAYAIGWAIRQ